MSFDLILRHISKNQIIAYLFTFSSKANRIMFACRKTWYEYFSDMLRAWSVDMVYQSIRVCCISSACRYKLRYPARTHLDHRLLRETGWYAEKLYVTLWCKFCGESVPDGLRELSHGPLVWAVDNQSFVDGSNYFFVLIRFNSVCWESCSSDFFFIYSILQSFSYQLIVSYNSNQNGLV